MWKTCHTLRVSSANAQGVFGVQPGPRRPIRDSFKFIAKSFNYSLIPDVKLPLKCTYIIACAIYKLPQARKLFVALH